jgi:hypothetical protein
MRAATDDLAPLAGLTRHSGRWRRTGLLSRSFELMVEDRRVARFEITRGFPFSARLTTADGSWDFVRSSFWRGTVDVRRAGEDAPIATYEPRTWLGLVLSGAGEVQFASGPRFERVPRGFASGRSAFVNDAGIEVTEARSLLALSGRGLEITVAGGVPTPPELPVLVGMALYLSEAAARRAGA